MCEGRGRRLMGKNEREWKREREGDRMRGGSNVGLIEPGDAAVGLFHR
jgi:hypothetical protein